FTGVLGQWAMDNESWERNGDATMVDLFKWHLAEEVEHRTVAYDLFEHLCRTQLGFYVSRQALMAIVFPLFVYFISEGARSLAKQDPDPETRKIGRKLIPQLLLQLQRVGKQTENVPTFSFLVRATARWVSPRFHPIHEGDTEQALAYLARSPAAMAAAEG
ncbi:MAG: metal-dependent hydrolase, partial [Pseudomonadales bacterium]|nr:metal-dependent hydrolase [Pseudomonadales bacterium]